MIGVGVTSAGLDGMRFRLRLPGQAERPVRLPVLGRHSVHNATGRRRRPASPSGWTPSRRSSRGCEQGWHAPHRDALRRIGPWLVIDDTYNAGPDSMAAALEVLGSLPGRPWRSLARCSSWVPRRSRCIARWGSVRRHRATCCSSSGIVARLSPPARRGAGMLAGRALAVPDRDAAALRELRARLSAGRRRAVQGVSWPRVGPGAAIATRPWPGRPSRRARGIHDGCPGVTACWSRVCCWRSRSW